MDRNEILAAIETADVLIAKRKYNKISTYFTDSGPNSRDKYPKVMALIAAGGEGRRIRCCMGANGSGKSVWLAYESVVHLTGLYPSWWKGYKFTYPINAWLCGKDGKALRAGLQEIMFGGLGEEDVGTGMLPKESLADDKGHLQIWREPAPSNCVSQFKVQHYTNGIFDGWSKCEFRTYEQGWAAFQGPTRDWIGFDEDPNDGKLLTECLARLRSKDGRPPGQFVAAFSPTFGSTALCKLFLHKGHPPRGGYHPEDPDVFCQHISLREVPHQSEQFKSQLKKQLELMAPNEISARIDGLPGQGSGLVYPVDLGFVVEPKQQIPIFWKRGYGMDPGQANFACVWVAEDPNTGVKYVYDEYKNGKVVYIIHVENIKNKGQWIQGGIDPHEAVKPRDTGETVQGYFESNGLHLTAAKGDPDALRARIRAMFESGALKIMDNCRGLLEEIQSYHYDEKDPNKIARGQEDHRLDALMYAIAVFDSNAQSYADYEDEEYSSKRTKDEGGDSGRSSITGY